MDLKTSVETVVLKKYMMLDGRASRSEYWWYVLAYFIAAVIAGVLDGVLGLPGILGTIVGLGLLIPSITVAVRRFHDAGVLRDLHQWHHGAALPRHQQTGLVGADLPDSDRRPHHLAIFLHPEGHARIERFRTAPRRVGAM